MSRITVLLVASNGSIGEYYLRRRHNSLPTSSSGQTTDILANDIRVVINKHLS